MDPFHPHLQTHQYSLHQQPPLQTTLPHHFPPRSGNGTPVQSPGLFSPSNQWANMNFSNQSSSDTSTAAGLNSPYLHPLQTQNHTVRETHIAQVDRDTMTGRKVINQYEVIEELGRGVHGKVKLAKNQLNGENVAIKIIPRFSKKRRLGKITTRDPVDKTKREIAILKKIRHPNVVALLEVIDDPELKKIYMILEHVELGEIVWRKKGLPNICQFERRRIEREIRGEKLSEEEEQYAKLLERRQTIKDMKRARMARGQASHADFWSFESGASVDDDSDLLASENEAMPKSARPRSASAEGARSTSKASSRVHSGGSISRGPTPQPIETIDEQMAAHHSSAQSPLPLNTAAGSPTALEGTMYGAYVDDPLTRARSPSMADSIISHMSSLDFNPQEHDPFADDFSYVPCFTLDQIRNIFRDTVLGLEYLHYQGVVHRDIKPANLLFTRDHRVKISDFGVSYFGRPIRDGEPDDLVSESEAYDFDNEVELAKTVGTPAFFAPELCYTDLDGPMPKVSEQIDVWSLGVTLYCLVFARIPFMAEDEFQMFRTIATEDAYIPRRRLRPVDPCVSPNQISLHKKANVPPYRDDNELAYEEIDELLHDLLRRTLIKNPDKRIRLMDVKRHPWVAEGIPNLHQWLEETDPRRKESGKKISVDEREMSSAVIPLTLLERAKSVVKKAVDKVIHGRSDGGRRRAASSVASSTGDSTNNLPTTPHPRDLRRKSLKPDDYFAALREHTHQSEHPLTQSVTASPLEASGDQWKSVGAASPRRLGFDVASDYNSTSDATEKSAPASTTPASSKPYQRHSYAKSITNAILSLTPNFDSAQGSPASNDVPSDDPLSAIRRTRDLRAVSDDSSRARSVDRGLFSSQDKRAEPKVSLSTATAPGNVKFRRPRPMRSIDLGKAPVVPALPSPVFSSPRALSAYQHPHPQSDPNIHVRQEDYVEARPATAHRIEDIPEGRVFHTSTPESFSGTKELNFEQAADSEAEAVQSSKLRSRRDMHPTLINCFTSSDDEMPGDRFRQPTDENMTGTVKSSSSNSIGDMATPLTSPTAMTSPMCAPSKENSESMLVFQSDPSLPTLLSGASSISADYEGDFLAHPGVVDRASFIETADSLTPPAIAKEASTGFPIDQDYETSSFAVRIGTRPLRKSTISPKLPPRRIAEDDNDSGSESEEEFLMMGKSKKKASVKEHMQATRIYAARRRDTNISIASTETAKKVGVDVE